MSPIKIEKVEDFDIFIKKFYSDSIFQTNRIVFPLESDIRIEKEYNEALRILNKTKNKNSNYFPRNKESWLCLKNNFFKGEDTICSIEGVEFKKRIYKTSQYVEENIIYSDSEQVMIIIKFRLIHNKWFLIDYLDEFESE